MKVKGLKKIITAVTLGASVCAGATVAMIGTQAPTVEAAPVNQWKNVKGKWYFYKNGKKTTGWKYLTKADGEKTPHWSYFCKDGAIRTNWVYLTKADGEKTPHWSYFGPNGWLRTGWQQMGKGTSNPDGNAAKHWSYFGGNGWLRTGWVQLGKGTSEPDGNSSKHWSYFGPNGWLRTSWQWMDKSQGEKTPHWSYFGGNGWLRTGMVTLGKADGEKVTHKSYFGGNGWLVANKTFTNAGTTYKADAKGWLTAIKKANTQAQSKPVEHTHNWVAQYTTKIIKHPAETHQITVCEASDGYRVNDITTMEKYMKDKALAGVPIHYWTWEETVTDKPAWTETVKVPNGYKCSSCGATKKHKHIWVAQYTTKTIEHPAETHEHGYYVCTNCGERVEVGETTAHGYAHALKGEGGSFSNRWETIVDKPAWTETVKVPNGYKCSSCAATKK